MTMPNKKVICEFCHFISRKDLVAQHIKSKCSSGVGKMLLKEWKETASVTPIKQFIEARAIQNIPIPSYMYEGSFYWFGVEPRMFDEEDSWASYIKCQDNLDAHKAFLEECLRSISLMDFIECEREAQVKSPEVVELRKKYNALVKEHLEDEKEHIADMDVKNRIIQRLTSELEDVRDSMDSPHTIHSLQTKITQLETTIRSQSFQIKTMTDRLQSIDDDHQMAIDQLYESNRIKRVDNEEMYEMLNEQYKALKKANEKLQINLKKEAQKIADKQQKEREKDKEKARKAKEKLKEEILLAKMKARRTSPKQKKKVVSSSESESDSSSESESESED